MSTMMTNKINVAIQVLPRAIDKDTYELVDAAIEVIHQSGLKYRVCPFETVVEGYYDEIMALVKEVHRVLYVNGTDNVLTYVKIQSYRNQDVLIEDKMEKYN